MRYCYCLRFSLVFYGLWEVAPQGPLPRDHRTLPPQVIPPADANAYGRHTPWLAD